MEVGEANVGQAIAFSFVVNMGSTIASSPLEKVGLVWQEIEDLPNTVY